MVRRLTAAMVAVVAISLAVAGGGALVLTGREERADERTRLDEDARSLAVIVAYFANQNPNAMPAVRRGLERSNAVAVPLATVPDGLPEGVDLDEIEQATLRGGAQVRKDVGSLLVAAAPVVGVSPRQIVVVTRDVPLIQRRVARWFVVASAVGLLAALVTGIWSARRLVRPLRAVEATTRRIADGDLAARVDVPHRGAEAERLATSVNTMAAALETSRQLERSFLLSVSHDLRTPLTSIRGWAEALGDGTTEDVPRAVAIIEGETRRLERLVADLLELANLETRQLSLHTDAVDVAEIVARTAEGFRPAFADAGVELEIASAPPLPREADGDRLAQVVANLVENALKFAERCVAVSVAAEATDVRIDVADDGRGIAPDDVPRVFERLYAGGRPPRRQAGTGLGLAIVAELAGAMGGDVHVVSTGATGTTMRVRVPLSPA
jgi:two-component system sensor histidine kinase BaeS